MGPSTTVSWIEISISSYKKYTLKQCGKRVILLKRNPILKSREIFHSFLFLFIKIGFLLNFENSNQKYSSKMMIRNKVRKSKIDDKQRWKIGL